MSDATSPPDAAAVPSAGADEQKSEIQAAATTAPAPPEPAIEEVVGMTGERVLKFPEGYHGEHDGRPAPDPPEEPLDDEERIRREEAALAASLQAKKDARKAAQLQKEQYVPEYLKLRGIEGVISFLKTPQNYDRVYFEDLSCISAGAYRMRLAMGSLLKEFDSFKWRGYGHDILNRLHYSDVIERTKFKDRGRINEVRFAAMMQNQLEKISDKIAKVQHSLTVCWHKLGARDVTHEHVIEFLQCMMAPTKNSAVSLRFELARLKDRFERHDEMMRRRILGVAAFHSKRRTRNVAFLMLTGFKQRQLKLQALDHHLQQDLEVTRYYRFFLGWKIHAFRTKYESKIESLEVRVRNLNVKLQEMEKDRLLQQALEEKLMTEQARMINKQLMFLLKQKCFRVMQKNYLDMKVLRLRNAIERLEKRLADTQFDLDIKTRECANLTQMLTDYTERNRCNEICRDKLVEYLGGKLRGYLTRGMQGWKEACRRSWRQRVTALTKELTAERQNATESLRARNAAEAKVAGLVQMVTDRDAKIAKADREKAEIAENFSEALKIAQGGKVLPALPSAFLCRDCGNELFYKAKDAKDEAILKELAEKSSGIASLEFFRDRIGGYLEGPKVGMVGGGFKKTSWAKVEASCTGDAGESSHEEQQHPSVQDKSAEEKTNAIFLSPRRAPVMSTRSPRRGRVHEPNTFHPSAAAEKTSDEKVEEAQAKASELLRQHELEKEARGAAEPQNIQAGVAGTEPGDQREAEKSPTEEEEEESSSSAESEPPPPREVVRPKAKPKPADTAALLQPSDSLPKEFKE